MDLGGVFFFQKVRDHLPKRWIMFKNIYLDIIFRSYFFLFHSILFQWYLERYILNQMPKANKRQYNHIWEKWIPWHQCCSFCFRHLIAQWWWGIERRSNYPSPTLEENLERVQAMWCRHLASAQMVEAGELGSVSEVPALTLKSFRFWLVGCQKYFLVGKKAWRLFG